MLHFRLSEAKAQISVTIQDADSLDVAGTKKEGAFYMWTQEEVQEVLGQHAPLFMSHYYVKAQGNADLTPRSDPHHEFGGLNCLRQAQTLQETAHQAGISEDEARQTIAECRQKLHERRCRRPRPHLDDKVGLRASVMLLRFPRPRKTPTSCMLRIRAETCAVLTQLWAFWSAGL